MTYGERLDLICATLLLPFANPSYGEFDPLFEKVCYYQKYLRGDGRENVLYSQHRKLQDRILQSLTARFAKPQRLDELVQILDLFYGDYSLSSFLWKNCKNKPESEYSLDLFYVQRIAEISNSFITLRDGHPALRNWYNKDDLFPDATSLHKAEVWNMLVRQSTPDLWIAGYYAFSPHISLPMLYNIPDEPILADLVLMEKLSIGLADIHTHFHSGINYQVQWELVTDLSTLRYDDTNRKNYYEYVCLVLKAGLLRLMLADYLHSARSSEFDFLKYYEKKNVPQDLLKVLRAAMYSDTIVDSACEECLSSFISWKQQLFLTFPDLVDCSAPSSKPWNDLLARSAYKNYQQLNTSNDILLFFEGLRLANEKYPPQFTHALLQYIRLKNYFFRSITQPETIHGLRQFRGYFGLGSSIINILRETEKNHVQDIERAIFFSYTRQPYLQLLEMKISPPHLNASTNSDESRRIRYKSKVRKQLRDLIISYCSVLETLGSLNKNNQETIGQTLDRLQNEQRISVPTLGIVYHFIKLDEKRSFYRQICWADEEQEKDRGDVYPETLRKSATLFSEILTELFQEIPYLAEYVVGLDAASDEMHHEPWLYAPVFRQARSRQYTYPIQPQTKSALPNLGLTYHVGEEFRTLLSGLRAIDEVIEHFGLKTGDRLGHAVALQVEPQLSQHENSTAILPVMEYLENLLWLWHLKGQIGIAFTSLPDLEQKIMQIARGLYPHYEGLTPYLLWRGYQLKFQMIDSEMLQRFKHGNLPLCAYSSLYCPDCQAYKKSHLVCRSAYAASGDLGSSFVWSEYDLLLSHFCPFFKNKYATPIFISIPREEIKLLEEIQEYLREKVQRKGLIVEVNPTSNSAISEIQHLFGHPLLKLNDWGLNKTAEQYNNIPLTISTDNPLIFRTTVENEMSYIYYMLIYMGYHQADVLRWIERVREVGIERCFIRRTKKPSVQYKELQEILFYLRKLQ